MNEKKPTSALAKKLAEEKDEKGNVIRANAYYFNFNAPKARYYYKNTRISSK